jgi:acetyltransferase-like isoleucine patch superfamily enzyme
MAHIAMFDFLLYVCNRIIAKIPFHFARLLFYRKVMKFTIGNRSFVFMDAWFDNRGSFTIGNHSVINQKCRLDNRGGISIGNNVSISAEVIILTADHDPKDRSFSGRTKPVKIDDFAFLGTRSMVLPGCTIGRGSVVAAGAVVTKDVPAFDIVAGVPAISIGKREQTLDYEIDYGRLFC